MSRQRPFESTASEASVRQVPLRVARYRLGCYMRCYTIFGDTGARGHNEPHE